MKKYVVDMTKGNIFRLLISFAIPIMISGVLQTLYNAADMIVVGKFAGKESLAAVGSTSSAINLMLNVFIGLSSATNVLVARKFGAGDKEGVSKAMHTAIAVCFIGGIILAIAGIFMSKYILIWMGSPEDVIDLSTLYMRIYFAGVPAVLLYNFGSAVMRAVGDAKRPTYFLTGAGIINITLNLVFVIVFKMDVAGVALATIIAQAVSALLVLRCLMKNDDGFKLEFKKLKIYAAEFKEIILLGIPAGIQGSLFSVSNVIIQSSINSVGSDAMAGNSAACSVEGMVYVAMNAFFHATLTFVGQNFGANDYKRMRQGVWISLGTVTIFGVMISTVVSTFAEFFLKFYTDIPSVIEIGIQRMHIVCATYFLCGIMEVVQGALRGLGVATRSMITCLVGVCGVRIGITAMFKPFVQAQDLQILYASFPISWAITTLMLMVLLFYVLKKHEKEWTRVDAGECALD